MRPIPMLKLLRCRTRIVFGAIALSTTLAVLIGSLSVTPHSTVVTQGSVSAERSLIGPVSVNWQGDRALATSGGRSSGGSFGSSSGGSSSGGSSSGGSSSGSSSSGGSSYSSGSSNTYSSDYSSTGSGESTPLERAAAVLIFLAIGAFLLFELLRHLFSAVFNSRLLNPEKYRARKEAEKARLARMQQQREFSNDIVTVTQVQVAMLATAPDVQREMNRISTELDWSTPEGLDIALTETALTLWRASDFWTHAFAKSETAMTREAAKQQFDALSLEERSKFDVESLSNVNGQLTHQPVNPAPDESADYIVVTLILGTAHDKPFIAQPITSIEALTDTIKALGALPPNYLMVYELLWSPQVDSDRLTYDELLLNYPHMRQI